MMDKNGIELKVGQIVKIEGGFFKADNGLFRISHAPENENWSGTDYCLKKVNKDFSDSKSKYSTAFFPLMVTVSKRETRLQAREHNKTNATIEVVGSVKIYKIKETHDTWSVRDNIDYVTESELEECKKSSRFEFELLEILNCEVEK
jgi:hypothetical protein